MPHVLIYHFLSLLLCCVFSTNLLAEQLEKQTHFLPAQDQHVRWVFSGTVSDEQNEQYGYFFQMERDGALFRSHAALFDAQTKTVLFSDESEAQLNDEKEYHWQVGHAFLHFNPINDSWVFGIKRKDKQGFNFKVDMASTIDKLGRGEVLRPGVSVFVGQTSLLNGHVQLGKDQVEKFVTAKHAWFRQMWMNKTSQAGQHAIHGILCRFDDGSSFYSVNLPEADALRGALAGWFDQEGAASSISQFIRIKANPEKDEVDIRIPSPHRHVVLSLGLKNDSMMAGFVAQGKEKGFCVLSEDMLKTA